MHELDGHMDVLQSNQHMDYKAKRQEIFIVKFYFQKNNKNKEVSSFMVRNASCTQVSVSNEIQNLERRGTPLFILLNTNQKRSFIVPNLYHKNRMVIELVYVFDLFQHLIQHHDVGVRYLLNHLDSFEYQKKLLNHLYRLILEKENSKKKSIETKMLLSVLS